MQFKQKLDYIALGVALVVIGQFVGCSGSDEKANKLFVEASQLVKSAQEAEKTSYSDAFKLYKEALVKLEKITSKYPSSQLAVKIAQGEDKIGSYTITEFKETIIHQAEMKADAEENLLACSLLAAGAVEDDHDKYRALTEIAEIAGKYAGAGQKDKNSGIFFQALQIAKTIEDDHYKNEALTKIAVKYAGVRQYDDKAFQIAKTIEDDHYKNSALVEIVGNCAGAKQYDKAFQIAKVIEDDYYRAYALAEISGKYSEAGQYDKALNIAKTIENNYHKARAMIKIADKYMESGQKNKAFEILPQALLLSQAI